MLAQEKVNLPPGTSFSNCWPYRATFHAYDSLASIIACSTYAKQEDFIRCGYGSFRCHDTLLCPLCCYSRLARTLLDEFGDAFVADRELFYIVASVSADPDETHRLIFRDYTGVDVQKVKTGGLAQPCIPENYGVLFTKADDLLQCRLIWDFIAEMIREFTGKGAGPCLSGVVAGPELAVRFQPLRVLPHANFLSWSSGFTVDDARRLRQYLRHKMRDCRRLKPGLYPAIACYRLVAADHLRAVTSYMCKPIDLAAAYGAAAERVEYEPTHMIALNAQTNAFLYRLPLVFHRLPRIVRYGACHSSSRSYFGYVTEWRQQQRERDAGRRRDRQDVYDPFDQPGYSPYRSSLGKWEVHTAHHLERKVLPYRSRYPFWKLKFETPPPVPPTIPPTATAALPAKNAVVPEDGANLNHPDIPASSNATAPMGSQPAPTT